MIKRDPRGTAIIACAAARQVHMDHRLRPVSRTKSDGSPVTDADGEAETRIRIAIGNDWPNDGFLGEESGHTSGTSGATWVADPLDGTIQYAAGMEDYGTLLARTDAQGIELGVIMHSPSDTFWMAERGNGSWKSNGRFDALLDRRTAVRVDRNPVPDKIADSIACFGHLHRMDGAGMDVGMLVSKFKTHLPVPRFLMFTLVAEGRLDVVIARLEYDWDLLANQILVEEAGGTAILLPLKNGRWVVAARSKELAEQTVAAVRECIY